MYVYYIIILLFRLSGIVVRAPEVRVPFPAGIVVRATDPEVRVPFPALPYFLRSSGSGTGSTQPRDYN
jgi:hypothetical protein